MSRLNSQQAGQGPVLIMLHGLFGSLDNFRSVSLHMERALTVIRMDLPGHGLSPSLPTLSIEAMAEEVLAEIKRQGIRDFHLLGHSLGGKVAMSVAGSPDCQGLQSLCVVDIAPKAYPPHHQEILDALQALDLQAIEDRREADSKLRTAIPDAGVRAFLLKSLYRHESGRFRWRFDLPQLANDYPLISRAPRIAQTIQPPTLFIKGGSSDYLTSDDEPGIKAVCAQPSLKIIPGAGHWPHAENPLSSHEFVRSSLVMSDSLRDQLLQAGFNAPKETERPKRHAGNKSRGKNRHGGSGAGKSAATQQQRPAATAQQRKNNGDAEAEARIARRKAIKAEIKTLIEAAAIKEFQGESVYRFILNKRIRELHVKEDIRLQLIAGTLLITRLNGSTWLVPEATATAIRELNPDWAIVAPATDSGEDTSGYEDFAVPDDLQW